MVLFKPDCRGTGDLQRPDALAAPFIKMKRLFIDPVEVVVEIVSEKSLGQPADPKGVGPHGT